MLETPKEIVDEMQSSSLLNQVRKIISFTSAKLEQQGAQRATIFDLRRIEFQAAEDIIKLVRDDA